jgi:hypothetical protein
MPKLGARPAGGIVAAGVVEASRWPCQSREAPSPLAFPSRGADIAAMALIAFIALIVLIINFGFLKGVLFFFGGFIVATGLLALWHNLTPGHNERDEFIDSFDKLAGKSSWGPGGSRAVNAIANEWYHEWRRSGEGMPAEEWIVVKLMERGY